MGLKTYLIKCAEEEVIPPATPAPQYRLTPEQEAQFVAHNSDVSGAAGGALLGGLGGGVAGLGINWYRRNKRIQELMAKGMTREEAERHASTPTKLGGMGWGALGGAATLGTLGYFGADKEQSFLDHLQRAGKEGYKSIHPSFKSQEKLDEYWQMLGGGSQGWADEQATWKNPDFLATSLGQQLDAGGRGPNSPDYIGEDQSATDPVTDDQ